MTYKSVFHISKMDCASEEQLIKMKLGDMREVTSLEFDLPGRKLIAFHEGAVEPILAALESMQLNTKLLSTEHSEMKTEDEASGKEKKLLWTVLTINISFFALEMITGLISNSMGLVSDSLDMLADAVVYGLALFSSGGSMLRKKRITQFAGYFQIILALIGFTEIIRRFTGLEKMPDVQTMIVVSIFALIANVICLYLLQKSKSKEAHMQASMIFTSNDVMINSGVIIAGLLVHWLHSSYPDLIIGTIVFIIVLRGAYRILKLAK